MIRIAAWTAAVLLTFPLFAGEVVPASNIVGGLPRAAFLGALLAGPDGVPTINGVMPGAPAEAIGLKAGDVIVSVGGQPVATGAAFLASIGKKRAGDSVTIVVRRGEQTLTKSGTLAARPLEQQRDYDIDYGSVDVAGAKRRVIVTRPRTPGSHPAVLLLGGIGCYSLDGLLRPAPLDHPYAKMLDALTRAGYVTMRVEKSGMGDSEGVRCDDPRADFDLETRAFSAGLAQLESMPNVDKHNVFLFAHSIGPLVAARIASEHPVRGIAVAETVGTGWLEYDLTNTRRQLLLRGIAYDDVERAVRHHEVCAHHFYIEKQTPEQILAADKTCASDLEAPAPYTYMQQVGSLDLAALWKKIDAPVLVFYGTADFVTDDYQSQYLRDMIDAFHPGHATYVRIEGMDHGLQLTGTAKASFEGAPNAPFAQRLADETLRFFNGLRGESRNPRGA
ncbi:MAG: alpha/beta fold hydrolase [Acidobacteria bacterium]|nr:alpha/beta fold hydrolase [Acidobacteriota bacterium]MBV9476144.1 alpha/beta fold hydrolase [Acidobacteriota bacterium]